MNLIVETDLGRDPDDFFALCYLAYAGVDIRAITITPGDPDQIAVARMFCKEVGLNIPIGSSHPGRDKTSSGGMHYHLLDKYKHSFSSKPDNIGWRAIEETYNSYPDSEFFIIGPATNVGRFLDQTNAKISRATMQGGFVGYDLYSPQIRLGKFEECQSQPTFNLNGDRPAGDIFINADIVERRFVSKNICHTVVYNKERYKSFAWKDCAAAKLFNDGMSHYLSKHSEKKFHDPTAAVCHLHPEVATWIRGNVIRMGKGWGSVPNPEGDYLIVDIDYEQLWSYF